MDRLRELREDNDLLQKDIAKTININVRTYSDYETNKCSISSKSLKLVSKFYKTSIDYILYRTDVRDSYKKCRNNNNDSPNRLKLLRKSVGKTQREVALDLDMPLKTYIKYENGERSLNTLLLNIFADYYNTSIDYIVYNTDDINPFKKSLVNWKEK